jgi:carbon-monoxide dehydrogenase medium subunit
VKPALFDYLTPTSIPETLDLLREYGDEAKVLAGGQSLVPMLNFRLARPAQLVDINHVNGLDEIRVEDGTLRIGAMTRHRALETHPSAAEGAWDLLHEAVSHVGHVHIRTRGTVGGSLAHADPSAELPAAVSALGATLVVQSADGTREVAPEEFFEGFLTTTMEADELLTEIRVPAWPAGTRSSFLEVCRRRGDFAQVAVAAVVTMTDGLVTQAGIALAGAAANTIQAHSVIEGLLGREPDASTIAELAGNFAADLDPPPDTHGPAAYRRNLARHLLQRALTQATRPAGAAEASAA